MGYKGHQIKIRLNGSHETRTGRPVRWFVGPGLYKCVLLVDPGVKIDEISLAFLTIRLASFFSFTRVGRLCARCGG